jgi:DNA-binding NarL/FixJ family response regulator
MTLIGVPLSQELGTPKLRVLVVDDAPSTRLFLRAVLATVRSLDVIEEAGTGRAAIEYATDLQPDVILLDLALPDTDGALVLQELLSVAPNARIVVLSNNAKLAGPALTAAGATGYIEKGLAPSELISRLSNALNTPLAGTALLPEMRRRFERQ